MSSNGRTGRQAIAALSAATAAAAVWSLATAGWQRIAFGQQFGMLQVWTELRSVRGMPGALAASMPVLVLVDILLAAGLALILCLSRTGDAHARLLRRALAAGALSALYQFTLRPLPGPPAPWMAPLDVGAFVLAAAAVADLVAFLVGYPRRADPAAIHAWYQRQYSGREGPAARLVLGLVRGTQTALRWVRAPSVLTADPASEDSLRRQVRITQRTLDFLSGPRFRFVLLAAGLVEGLLFVFGDGKWTYFLVSLATIVGPFLPLLGAQALEVNYRCGSAEDRRRIGWIYLGPFFGFLAASFCYALLMLDAIAFQGADGEPARLFGIDTMLLFVVATFDFAPVLVGSFLLGLAFSIFYDGAIDPRLTIRRGAVVGFGGIVLTGLFVAIEGVIQSQLVLHLGLSAQANALMAGTLSAILFAPLRKRIARGVDRTVERFMPVSDLADGVRATVGVCFIDMSGYTALSERDEPAALIHAALLQKCGRSVAARCGGELVKSLGDAVMLRFPTPASAVEGARILRSDYGNGAATLGVTPLPLHGGLHFGEVVASRDGDLYGAAVNLAARLCSAAKDGQLVVSETTRVLLPDVAARALGQLHLKNVQDPVTASEVDW